VILQQLFQSCVIQVDQIVLVMSATTGRGRSQHRPQRNGIGDVSKPDDLDRLYIDRDSAAVVLADRQSGTFLEVVETEFLI
jgi:hypothetical protein